MVHSIKNEKGFTLAELLVALTIFAIGLLAIAGMQVTAMQTNSRSNTLSSATALAEGVLEELLSWDPANPILQSDSGGFLEWDFDPDSAGIQNTDTIDGAGTYRARYSVDADYENVLNVTMITVEVDGEDPGNENRVITLVGFKKAI